MSRICQLTGKKAMVGNNVSHSNRKTRRRFNANIKTKRIFVPESNVWIKVKVSMRALRTMNKLGVYNFLKRQIAKGYDPFIWVEDPKAAEKSNERGYRRLEQTDAQGNKSYSITFEPEAADNNRKVRLSSVIK